MKTKWRVAGLFFPFFILFLVVPLAEGGTKARARGNYLVYVGTYTGPSSKGIYAFRFDTATGEMKSIGVAAETQNPSFLAADAGAKNLYAVNELSDYQGQKSGAVSAFAIDHKTGKLSLLNQVSSRGAGPCYITLDGSGHYVLVANYDSGTVATFPVRPDAKLGEAAAVIQHSGHGSDPERQGGPHAHQIELTKDNRFAVAADLGLDQLLVYKFDPATGALEANRPPFAAVDPGSGPRHFSFTPDGKFLFVLAEMRSAITGFRYNAQAGTLRKLQTVSSLPPGFKAHNDAAEIAVSPSGKFLYASNRGNDTIAVFAIGREGKLTPLEYTPTQGKTPRGFAIDPTGHYLLAANQESNNLVVFRIDASSGRLKATGKVLDTPTPVAVMFVEQ
jgi:6-phosphogluconolactonase